MEIECPKCGAHYNAEKSDIGKYGECECGNRFIMKEYQKTYFFRTSACNYFWSILISLILIFPLPFIGIPLLIYRLIQIYKSEYTLTSDRLIAETGWLSKKKKSIFLSDIRNVEVSQGVWQRICNVGTIRVSTSGNSGYEITMEGISDPDGVVKLLNSGHI
jgi:uncharacterized membrane protein YdbT with pleckstrin-like domain